MSVSKAEKIECERKHNNPLTPTTDSLGRTCFDKLEILYQYDGLVSDIKTVIKVDSSCKYPFKADELPSKGTAEMYSNNKIFWHRIFTGPFEPFTPSTPPSRRSCVITYHDKNLETVFPKLCTLQLRSYFSLMKH